MCNPLQSVSDAVSGVGQSVSDAVAHAGDVIGSDPIAQGAVIAAAAYATGGASLAAEGATAAAFDAAAGDAASAALSSGLLGGAAATEGALIPLEAISLGSSTVASVTATTAEAGASWSLPSWANFNNGLAASKILLPAIAQNATNRDNINAAKDILTLQNQNAQRANMALTRKLNGQNFQPGGVSVRGLGSFLPMALVAGAAYAAFKLSK